MGIREIEKAEFSKTIEILRGMEDSFDLEIENRFAYPLEELEIAISGFLSKYIEISPEKINSIAPGQKAQFHVTIQVLEYKEKYEEQTLNALIKGYIVKPNQRQEYEEIQNIKRFIEDVYNAKRLHSSIGYKTPNEMEAEVLNIR